MQRITQHYPKAESLSSLKETILKELARHNMNPSQCVWGTSICCDEVNNSFNFMCNDFIGPGPFRLGGLSGLPFSGKTGFVAFALHIPENGGAFILYGPHIGISRNGKVGELHREGQPNNTSCCGSLNTGLQNITTGNVLNISRNDYQQGQVNKLLTEHYSEIIDSDEPIKNTTEVAYKQIKLEMTDIVATNLDLLGNSPILMMGGIVINTDWNEEDFFEVRDVSIFNE
jgi:hypothetical protein